MNTTTGGLWSRLEGFELDQKGVALPFTARLARENGWTLARAGRVVQEYKKFLFLAVEAGHPVTPSGDVDQAWHLHMVYTRSYWDALCGEVLGSPLHHGPTEGGAAEGGKFHDWYARTLESYEKMFGRIPPQDIWPLPHQRFAHAAQGQWVDRSRYWLVPRLFRLPRVVRPLALVTACGLLGVVTLMPGCTVRAGQPDGGGTLSGPGFVMNVMLLVLAVWMSRWIKSKSMSDLDGDPEQSLLTDRDQAAALSGGGRRVMQSAVVRLFREGALVFRKTGILSRRIFSTGVVPQDLSRVEEAILEKARSGTNGLKLGALMGAAPESLRLVETRLAVLGLKPATEERNRAAFAVVKPFFVVGLLVAIMTFISGQGGVSLIVMLVILGLLCLYSTAQIPRITPAGRTMLGRLHGDWREKGSPSNTSQELAWSVALLGPVVLQGVAGMEELQKELQNHHSTQGGGDSGDSGISTTGCSGSGCGSSGCGSSGCGSSGCGGGCGS